MKAKFSKKIYFFVGTTTELIKLAPIIKELEENKINFKIITSGQTQVKFDELSFMIKRKKADIALHEKTDKSSIYFFGLWIIKTLISIPFLRKEFKGLNKNNSYFIIHGDPVSSLIGALLAKYYGLCIVHIESGLRSFNYLEPFPEEICRVIISKLAMYHFCPNKWSLKNLKNISGYKFDTKQNTLIESTSVASRQKSTILKELKLKNKKYFILVMHRQEHVIFGKEKSKKILNFIFKNSPKNIKCIFVTHATTGSFLNSFNFEFKNNLKSQIRLVSRLHYKDFVTLLKNCEFIATDGGSNQEEAYYFGIPCLILRNFSERIEGLGESAVIAKQDKKRIDNFLKNYKDFKRRKVFEKIKPSHIIFKSLQ